MWWKAVPPPPLSVQGLGKRTLNLGGSLQHFGLGYSGEIMGNMIQELDSSFEYEHERVYSWVCGVSYKVTGRGFSLQGLYECVLFGSVQWH